MDVNICFQLKNNSYNKIININKYLDGFVKFDKNHIPHITILQFYTDMKHLIKINKKIKKIKYNINDFVIKYKDLEITKYDEQYVYGLKINSNEFKLLFDIILKILLNLQKIFQRNLLKT